MEPDVYLRVCQHFQRLAELAPDERDTAIDVIRAGEDASLVGEIQKMLAADEQVNSSSFLNSDVTDETLDLPNSSSLPLVDDHSLVGQCLDHYEIEAKIGEGGMGAVYRAYDAGSDRHVAIKVIRPGLLGNQEHLIRFRSEAKAAAQLRHAGIVPVYHVGRDGDYEYFAMAMIEGDTLQGSIRSGRPVDQRKIAELFRDVARALDYAHEGGIVHRDIKPANILLDAAGQPLLTDFGIAKRLLADEEQTSTGQIMGTLVYAAPEQLSDAKNVGRAADIYGLGATLYECLTGATPFSDCRDLVELLNHKQDESPALPRTLRNDIDVDLQAICMRCLERNPQDRYATAEELANALEQYLRGEPVDRLPWFHALKRAVGFRQQRREFISAGAAIWLLPIQALVHPAIGLLIAFNYDVRWLWAILSVWAFAAFANNFYYHWRQYWRLSLTERLSGVLMLATNVSFVCLFLIHGPRTTSEPIRDFLDVYPPLCLVVAVSICAHAGSHSGRWIVYGSSFFLLSLIIAWQLAWGPLMFAVATVVVALVIDRDIRNRGEG